MLKFLHLHNHRTGQKCNSVQVVITAVCTYVCKYSIYLYVFNVFYFYKKEYEDDDNDYVL